MNGFRLFCGSLNCQLFGRAGKLKKWEIPFNLTSEKWGKQEKKGKKGKVREKKKKRKKTISPNYPDNWFSTIGAERGLPLPLDQCASKQLTLSSLAS